MLLTLISSVGVHSFSADPEDQRSPTPQQKALERCLMMRFYAAFSEGFLDNISHYRRDSDMCGSREQKTADWCGITCTDGVITVVCYVDEHSANFGIYYLPHYVQRIYIRMCSQEFMLETRKLPRDLEQLCLSSNRIHGSIDWRELPRGLIVLDVAWNRLQGPVDLCHLPPKMMQVSLHGNEIVQPVVLYGNLPPGIREIALSRPKDSNRIGGVRPVRASEKAAKGVIRLRRF